MDPQMTANNATTPSRIFFTFLFINNNSFLHILNHFFFVTAFKDVIVIDLPIEAAQAMLRGIMDSLESGNLFNAAYNMNRLGDNDFVEDLFKIALKRAVEADDLWRQLRCYQELGWDTEAKNLLTANAAEIGAGNNLLLRRDLAKATEDAEALFIIEQEIARAGVSAYFVSAKDEDTDDDAE